MVLSLVTGFCAKSARQIVELDVDALVVAAKQFCFPLRITA